MLLTTLLVYLQISFVCESPKVVDGDTLYCKKQGLVRLQDINAPEIDTREGKNAKLYLQLYLFLNPKVECLPSKLDKYGRILAACTAEGARPKADLSQVMFKRGLARKWYKDAGFRLW